MVDMLQMLKDDHALVRSEIQHWLGQQNLSSIPPERLRFVQQLLLLHMAMEEQFLYPKMEKVGEASELIHDSYREHKYARDILLKLTEGRVSADDLHDQLHNLLDVLDHHIREEETELFPLVRENFSPDQIQMMGNQMMEMKNKETSRQKTL